MNIDPKNRVNSPYDYHRDWPTPNIFEQHFTSKKDFKVSKFQSRIAEKLAECKGLNHRIRCLWYSLIDAIIRIYLSTSDPKNNPEQHKKYIEYMNYRAFVAQKKMVVLTNKEKIEAICDDRKIEILATLKKKLTSQNKMKLRKELSQLNTIEASEKLREEAKESKINMIKELKKSVQWNRDILLKEELEQLNDQPVYEKISDLLDKFKATDLKNCLKPYSDPLSNFQEVKNKHKETIQRCDLEKNLFEKKKMKKLKENLNLQITQISNAFKYKNIDCVTAKKQLLDICKNYPFKELNDELNLYRAEKDFDDFIENNYNRVLLIIDNFMQKEIQPTLVVEENAKKKQKGLTEEVAVVEVKKNAENKIAIPVNLHPTTKKTLTDEEKNNLIKLLPGLPADIFNVIEASLNELSQKEEKINFIKTIKKLMVDYPKESFYSLLWYLNIPLDDYKFNIGQYNLEKLSHEKIEIENLSKILAEIIHKTSNDSSLTELSRTNQLLTLKFSSILDEYERKIAT